MCVKIHISSSVLVFYVHRALYTNTVLFVCYIVSAQPMFVTPSHVSTSQLATVLKTDCTQTAIIAFIFHPIIGESIRECERSTHKRPVSCLPAQGTDCLYLPVCLSVRERERESERERETKEVAHSLKDNSYREESRLL